MRHFWQKPTAVLQGRRVCIAVIDNDDEFRRGALRLLRRLDCQGLGLLDTAAATRLIASSPPAITICDASRAHEVIEALAPLAAEQRPAVIVSAAHGAKVAANVFGTVRKPLDDEQFLEVVEQALRMGSRRKSVLLVDDDDDIREMYSTLLEEEGYVVVPASDGKAAWSAIEAGLKPDVILLDMMMPVMNGHEVYERLQTSAHRQTPVVVITAGAPPTLAAPVLRKPIDMRDLLRAVAQASA